MAFKIYQIDNAKFSWIVNNFLKKSIVSSSHPEHVPCRLSLSKLIVALSLLFVPLPVTNVVSINRIMDVVVLIDRCCSFGILLIVVGVAIVEVQSHVQIANVNVAAAGFAVPSPDC